MKRITRQRKLTEEEILSNEKVREQVKKDFPPLNDELKVGDKVGIQDRRDGAVFEYTHVTDISKEDGYVSVAAGYRVAAKCCLKVPPEINGHEWEWKQIVYGSCAGSWRCKKCLTVHDMGQGRNIPCDNGDSMKRKG